MKNRYSATLLLALPFVVAMVPAVAHSSRTIEVKLSGSAIVPEQIEMRVGERVRLQVTSTDGAHACHVNGLGLDARIPGSGATVAVDVTPAQTGIFQIDCLDGGPGQRSTKGRFVVNHEDTKTRRTSGTTKQFSSCLRAFVPSWLRFVR
jgi:heme/copper-type cytochrome/quinol oxidase subunit 2